MQHGSGRPGRAFDPSSERQLLLLNLALKAELQSSTQPFDLGDRRASVLPPTLAVGVCGQAAVTGPRVTQGAREKQSTARSTCAI